MRKKLILENNKLAVKTYFEAMKGIFAYRHNKEIDREKLISLCKNLSMSNMMPAHFINNGVLAKKSILVKGRWRAFYELKTTALTDELLNAIATEKMNYVNDANERRARRLFLHARRNETPAPSEEMPAPIPVQLPLFPNETPAPPSTLVESESAHIRAIGEFAEAMINYIVEYVKRKTC